MSEKATSTGRGLIFITAAKLWFMVAGYIVVFSLPRKWALGSADQYGVWVLILSLVSQLNNVMVTATIQGVSKFSSEGEGKMPGVLRAALRMHVFVGGGAAAGFFLLAPVIAGFLHDESLTPLLRVAAIIVLAYSFYSSFVGAANGVRAFHKQAALDMTFSTTRTLLVVGLAALTHSVLASVAGFSAAALFVLLVSMVVVGFGGRPTGRFPTGTLFRFFIVVAVYLFIVNGLMFTDGFLLKRLVAEAATRAGEADPKLIADTQEGYYGAVQQIARIPYQLILAVTFVIFPLVSRATFEKDAERTRRYVETTMRYSLMVVAALATVLGVRPDATLHLMFKPEYAVGAPALTILLAGYVCFSLFNIAGTILNSAGLTLPTTVLGAITLVIAVISCYLAIGYASVHGLDRLQFAAGATTLSMAAGLILSGAFLKRQFGSFLPPRTLAVVLLASGVCWGLGRLWPSSGFLSGKVGTLIFCAVAGVVFAGVLVATQELNPRELLRARKS